MYLSTEQIIGRPVEPEDFETETWSLARLGQPFSAYV